MPAQLVRQPPPGHSTEQVSAAPQIVVQVDSSQRVVQVPPVQAHGLAAVQPTGSVPPSRVLASSARPASPRPASLNPASPRPESRLPASNAPRSTVLASRSEPPSRSRPGPGRRGWLPLAQPAVANKSRAHAKGERVSDDIGVTSVCSKPEIMKRRV